MNGKLDAFDEERLAAVHQDKRHAVEHLALRLQRRQRSMREIDADAVGGRKLECAASMVAVLVRNQDGAYPRRLQSEPRQPPLRFGEREPAVDEHYRARGLGHQAVARAAAGERGEAQRRYFSCVQQRKDALRGLGVLRCAVLVKNVHQAARGLGRDLHPVLLGLHLRIAAESKKARKKPPSFWFISFSGSA